MYKAQSEKSKQKYTEEQTTKIEKLIWNILAQKN